MFKQRARFHFLLFLLLFLILFSLSSRLSAHNDLTVRRPGHVTSPGHHGLQYEDTLSLDEGDCSRTFPGLTKEVDDAVSLGSFQLPFSDGAVLQAKIESGQVYDQLFLLS